MIANSFQLGKKYLLVFFVGFLGIMRIENVLVALSPLMGIPYIEHNCPYGTS